jgi:hypothetical protein
VDKVVPLRTAPLDDRTLKRLVARPGITGLAVITGRISGGLAVRDYDRADAYHAWAKDHPKDAARLPTVRTARGYHVYGRLDAEDYRKLGDGEFIADSGHYVVLPPTIHPDGPTYTWVTPLPLGELPLLPSSLTHAHPSQLKHTQPPTHPQDTQTTIAWWTSAVVSTNPTGPGQRNRCIFELARRLKAINPDATPTELRPILQEWHRRALPFIRTQDFTESWTDLAVAWQRIRRPAGQSLAEAAARADAAGLPGIAVRLGYDGCLGRLAALCLELARQWGDRPFPLGCEVAGQYLGVSTRHAGRLLKTLEFDRVLQRVTMGTKRTGNASEWRFLHHQEQGGNP